jgi:preprotein translocase subunit SecF
MIDLADALTILATSPVAKDREAIARLEKVAQEDIQSIMQRLENQSVLVESIELNSVEQSRQLAKTLIVSAGLMCGGLSCLVTIWFRPSLALAVVPVGFVVGASAQSIALVNEARHRIRG